MALVFRADDHNFSVSLDDLALVAHGLDGRTYFHDDVLLISGIEVCSGRSFIQSQHGIATEMRSKSGFAAPGDAPLRQIVRAHLEFDSVAFDDADIVHSQLSGNVRRDDVPVGKPYFERGVGKSFDDSALCFDDVVFGHISSDFTGSGSRHRSRG